MEIWPFSVFARPAWRNSLTLAITPARLCALSSWFRKKLESISFTVEGKPQVEMWSKSCHIFIAAAFKINMELAYNICFGFEEMFRNLKDKIKDIEESAQAMDFGSFQVRKYYYISRV